MQAPRNSCVRGTLRLEISIQWMPGIQIVDPTLSISISVSISMSLST